MENSRYQSLLSLYNDGDKTFEKRLQCCFTILATARAIDESCSQRLVPQGLSESRFIILILLMQNKSGLSPYEIAGKMDITRATVTGLLDGMERQGLIYRNTDNEDRRRMRIVLTQQGNSLAKLVSATHTEWIASLFNDLTENEQNALAILCKKISDKIIQINGV